MTVYVDDYDAQYGRMKMCHMIADSTEELLDMVDKIGVRRKWIQKAGTEQEHFDISKGKKAEAIKHGAKLVTSRELVCIIQAKRHLATKIHIAQRPVTETT